MSLTARDLMQTEVVSVPPDRPLAELEELLLKHRIHGAPVVEDGRLVGIVSRSDVIRQLKLEEERVASSSYYFESYESFDVYGSRDEDPTRVLEAAASRVAKLRVRDVMIDDLITVAPDASLQELARVMADRRVHRVLVTEDGKLRGIVTSVDLVRLLADGRVTPS